MSNENNEKERKEIVPFWRSGFGELDKVFDNFKRDFEHAFAPAFTAKPLHLFDATTTCDLVDEGDKFVVTADMPRIKKEEVNLNVGDDYIDISAEHKESDEEKKKKYIRKEHSEISIHRRLSLPQRVKSSDVKAKLNNGILTVEIPKEKPTPQPKTTKIQIE
ncbi:MAG: Hsp20/alpha crystallin family protein [Nitrosopumilus sp.]|nr:Hsp20/alpha crystallin family protein [Nitrosopumilus sp.]MDH3517008.1 Hsp20/alpha crystallin family protein [Nitrosopumilus sp.]MDH3565611.1 Hsp20/alpha crystallin family protein [Nitrosopumilus sp.]MDH5416564.1 Hsp20/alpha crystallin family protein [Nitrosopumilus sp.]MDH5555164.1 Hsp20/alpha crystallin family protein [Nitrosopumilus sp.]